MAAVHNVARTGFGIGTNDLYDRIRPRYQSWALQQIKSSLPTGRQYNIAEIGSGTGIFTRDLLGDPEWFSSIKELRAIEPSAGMRDVFSRTVQDPRVRTVDGTFDATGIEDGWADIIIIAQAFHWCPDHHLAAQEFSRILKPDGVVALIWNLENRDAERWAAQVRDLIEQYEQGTPQFRLDLWRSFFDTPEYQVSFGPPDEKQWSYHLEATEDIVVDRASSKSYITILPAGEKAKVQVEIREIVRRGDDLEWIDKASGKFKYPYKTWTVISRKKY